MKKKSLLFLHSFLVSEYGRIINKNSNEYCTLNMLFLLISISLPCFFIGFHLSGIVYETKGEYIKTKTKTAHII